MKQKLLNFEMKNYWLDQANLCVYQIDDGETHWMVASSEQEALQLFVMTYFGTDITFSEYLEDYQPIVTEMSYSKNLTIRDETEGAITKTCREWIEEQGKGFLASTTY